MAMGQRAWARAGAIVIAIALVASLLAALATLGGSSDTATNSNGPSPAALEALAIELSSGDDNRIAGALADIPLEAKERAVQSLGALEAVEFDSTSVRFDEPTGAALVDARLVASDGSVRDERIVLVNRDGRWLVFSTLQQPGATPLDTSG